MNATKCYWVVKSLHTVFRLFNFGFVSGLVMISCIIRTESKDLGQTQPVIGHITDTGSGFDSLPWGVWGRSRSSREKPIIAMMCMVLGAIIALWTYFERPHLVSRAVFGFWAERNPDYSYSTVSTKFSIYEWVFCSNWLLLFKSWTLTDCAL